MDKIFLENFFEKIVSIAFALVLFLTGGVFFVPADESAEKVSLELEFTAKAAAADSDGASPRPPSTEKLIT